MLIEAICDYITLFDHIYFPANLTTVLTPYAEMVLHKRIQKSVRWQATKFPPEILSPLPLGIACGNAIAASRHSNNHELLDMVHIYYWADVFQTAYKTQTCVMKNIIIALIFVKYSKDIKKS
uniref:Uncharacterized protein n=1 Tax=Lactuca sativa TaxID=4236 RepID=A0A9R1VFH3_LACSA|nr:hypothetical protein LSAT_V11C500265090 [Lactuca sativa]